MRTIGFLRSCWATSAIGLLGALATATGLAGGQEVLVVPGPPEFAILADEPTTTPPPEPKPSEARPSFGKDATKIEVTDAPLFGVTGDWFGGRESLLDIGIDVRPKFTQFYQGVASGGLRQGFRYGLKFDYFATVEAEKLVGWKGLFINLHGESRFGQSVNRDVGSLSGANFALEFPQSTGAASALTALQIDQFVGSDFIITFGKLNAQAGINMHPFIGGNGIDRFMNEGFVFNPIFGRTYPYSTPGAGFQYLRDGETVFVFQVLDSSGRPDTSGLRQMFRNGASLFAQARVPMRPYDLPGHVSLDGAYTSGKFSVLSEDDFVILPTVPVMPEARRNSWVTNLSFDQFLVMEDESSSKGWGVFGNIGIADQYTNPVYWNLYFGAGGMSPIPGRSDDAFGVGYYYLGVSDHLQEILRPYFPVRDEQIFEFYYNAKVAKDFTLGTNIQVIDPAQLDAQPAILFGLRAKIDF